MATGHACPTDGSGELHVVAAVVEDEAGRILIARRPHHLHQGGLWEFPGGKVEPGETRVDALARELHEELGITVEAAHPLIRVHHAYPDRRVLLDVWRVTGFHGAAHGREGQPVQWLAAEALRDYPFPAANLPIIAAARLPPFYLITPEPGSEAHWPAFLQHLRERVMGGIRLVQLRAHHLGGPSFARLSKQVLEVCREGGARLLLNGEPGTAMALDADGVHLTAARLQCLRARPLPADLWVAASCHTIADLERAAAVGVDFAVVSPVNATASHAQASPLGWPRFAAMAEASSLPVYALGGVGPTDLTTAREHGAQGVAAIRGLWNSPLITRNK